MHTHSLCTVGGAYTLWAGPTHRGRGLHTPIPPAWWHSQRTCQQSTPRLIGAHLPQQLQKCTDFL